MMDRPSTSQQSIQKVEMFEVREHVPYQAEVTRAPAAYDEESGEMYTSSWSSAWTAICQFVNLLHHMQIAIVVFCVWRYALTYAPDGSITNLQLHIVFAGTGLCAMVRNPPYASWACTWSIFDYQLFLVESVLTLHRHNAWSFQLNKDSKRIVHGCLQVLGSVFVLAGTFLGLAHVNMEVNTAHGICGVIALCFTMLSFVSGVIALFSSKVRLLLKSNPVKILHMAVGMCALSMGLITMILGFNSISFSTTQGPLSTALIIFVVMIMVYTLVQPILDLISTIRKTL